MVEIKMKNADYRILRSIIERYRAVMNLRAKDLVMVVNGVAKEVYPANKKLANIHRFLRFLESRADIDSYADDKKLVTAQRQHIADSSLPEICVNCIHARLMPGLKSADGRYRGRCHIHGDSCKEDCKDLHHVRNEQLDKK